MQRFFYLSIVMVLSSSAHAGSSFSFMIGGHRISIDVPRHCDSPSCVSVSLPSIYRTGRRRDDDDDNRNARQNVATPATPPASAPVCAPPAVQGAAAPSSPPVVPSKPFAATLPQPTQQSSALPTPEAAPQMLAPAVSRVSHEIDDEPADTPLGDWQTEGNKGSVRIERCGKALCGYVLDLASNAKGETILIDMRPKTASEWSGYIYSRDSGNTYHATIAMQGPNALRVQACAIGRFFCSGNVWSRINLKPARMVTYRQILSGT